MKFVNTISFRVSFGELEMTLLFSILTRDFLDFICYERKERHTEKQEEKPSKGFSLKCGSSLV